MHFAKSAYTEKFNGLNFLFNPMFGGVKMVLYIKNMELGNGSE